MRSPAIALVLESVVGGSPTQVYILAEKIKHFCEDHNIKIYCFANRSALSHSYLLLSIGNKVYADKFTLVGGFGTPTSHLSLYNFFNTNKIRIQSFKSSENALGNRISWSKDPKDVDYQLIKSTANILDKKCLELIERFRPNKFDTNKYSKEIDNGHIWTGEQAKEIGLVDELGSYESVLYREFPRAIFHDLTKKSQVERYWDIFRRFVKIATLSPHYSKNLKLS
eukprot:TRINITY_DN1648_c0_g3_i10.p1 TRINITY_DN1648_c0_g3~~TRINITY_DN1648_c0_g3_i10.p1  ORF type:complete len:225 (-),score=21.77 TRINITY_DN1648_c0_g3_i10:228-902(-)